MVNLEELKGRVKGIYPPIATPLTETEEFDEQGMRRLVQYLLESGVHGLFVLGSTGEFATFTPAERQRIIEVVVDEVDGKVPVLANATEVGTKKTIESARMVAGSGADAMVLMVPYYFTHTASEVLHHFREVTSSVDIPVFLYNNPFSTKFNLTPEMVQELSQEERIVGIKDSSNDFAQFQELLRRFRGSKDFKVFQGEELHLAPSVLLGASGAVLTIANVVPKLCVEIYEAGLAGDIERAFSLQDRLAKAFEICQVSSAIDAVKAALALRGICGGTAKKPFMRLCEDEVRKIKEILAIVRPLLSSNFAIIPQFLVLGRFFNQI